MSTVPQDVSVSAGDVRANDVLEVRGEDGAGVRTAMDEEAAMTREPARQCPRCKGSVPFHERGVEYQCPHCGMELVAVGVRRRR